MTQKSNSTMTSCIRCGRPYDLAVKKPAPCEPGKARPFAMRYCDRCELTLEQHSVIECKPATQHNGS